MIQSRVFSVGLLSSAEVCGERLAKSFKNGFADFGETLDDLAMWASYNIMGIIIFVVIIVVLVKVKPFARLRKRLGTRSERKAAKAAEKNAE